MHFSQMNIGLSPEDILMMKNFPFHLFYFSSSFATRLLVRLWFLVFNSSYLLLYNKSNLSILKLQWLFYYFFLKVLAVDYVQVDGSWLEPGLESFYVWWLILAIDLRPQLGQSWSPHVTWAFSPQTGSRSS